MPEPTSSAIILALIKNRAIVEGISQLIRVLKTTSDGVEALTNAPLLAAIDLLEQATRSDKQSLQSQLILEARLKFTDALSLAKGNKKWQALIGLAKCCEYQGDSVNRNKYLWDLLVMPIQRTMNVTDYLISAYNGVVTILTWSDWPAEEKQTENKLRDLLDKDGVDLLNCQVAIATELNAHRWSPREETQIW
jgi:hypothetical protein